MLSARLLTSTAGRYTSALFVMGMALAIRLMLSAVLGENLPYVTLFAAIALSARFFGTGPSISALVAAVIGARYWFIQPTHAFTIPNLAQSLGMAGFLFTSVIIIAFGEMSRRSAERVRKTRKELEAQVRQRTEDLDLANKGLRDLTGHVLHLQDQERRRIARELHDSAGQSLAALAMNLSRVQKEVKTQIETLADTAAIAAESRALVEEITTDIRTISYLLHPPMLDEAGLGSALRWYIEGFAQRSKIAVDLDLPDDFGRLPQDFETAIFRVVQECLTNILRHSESPVASLRVARSANEVRIEVQDQGRGIPREKLSEVAEAHTPGVGMRGMRERVLQLGGTLEVKSEGAGKGTVVIAVFPVAPVAAVAASARG